MTIKRFDQYLNENITDEMFEALVLDYLKEHFTILACNIDNQKNKCYTLQDNFVGDAYSLIISTTNTTAYNNLPEDKYMIANKNKHTLKLLVAHACRELPLKKTPYNVRNLLIAIKENYSDFLFSEGPSFAEKINNIVERKYKAYEKYIADLYDAVIKETIKLLIFEVYLANEKDWNTRTGKIKLTGVKGENRICECRISLGIGCVYFTVKDPFYPLHYYIKNENDIVILANEIVNLIKEKRLF